MGAVGKAISGATSFLTGGDPEVVSGGNYAGMTDPEKKRLKEIEDTIGNLFSEQGPLKASALSQNKDIQALFANNLKTFMTNNGQATPDQIQQASNFVDQTFTNPTQNVVNQNISDYQSQAQGRAAALGRNPNADIATQQAIAGEGLRQNIGLQAERGSRIQSNVNDQYQRNLGSLNAGMQGSGYLNNLAQQAFQNQMSLLNGRTGLAQFYQAERGQKPVGVEHSSGLLGNVNSVLNQTQQIGGSIGKVAGMLGGIGA